MPKKQPQLAKLTRPRLHKAVARERLFSVLDDARQHKPCICVVGPPGAGKTTLVASWLDARNIKGIWYQVDPGDSDLATFFYYLGEAAKPYTRKRQRPLPRLTPEYLADVPGFSRRFFRELFSRLPEGATLALDNYQEVEPDEPLHRLITQAVDEIPHRTAVILVTRRDPPDCYARLLANDRVDLVDWDMLKLSTEEVGSIAGARLNLDADATRLLHRQCEGWAAGLILSLEQYRRGAEIEHAASTDSPKAVFDYFAGQFFDHTDATTRDLLLRLSLLPKMTLAGAAALTGSTRAAELLEDHYRRHLFTDRRGTKEPVYQFHSLFRAFLQERAQNALNAQETQQLTQNAARILEEQNMREEAFQLYLRAADETGASAIILREAESMIAQGRWRSVEESVDALSPAFVEKNCWLLFWRGMAKASTRPADARPVLIASYELAVKVKDVFCEVQASAGVLHTYMLEYKSFRPMDPWIEILKSALARVEGFPDARAELRTRSALLIALSFRNPNDPELPLCADRVYELVQTDIDANLRTLSAAYLVAYGCRTGPVSYARKSARLLQTLIDDSSLSALTVGWGWWALAFFYLVVGDYDACRRAVAIEDKIGRDESLYVVSRFAAVTGAHLEMDTGNLEAAQAWSDRLDEVSVPGLAYDRALSNTIKAFLLTFRGDFITARKLAEEAIVLLDEAGVHHLRCLTRSQLAWILLLVDQIPQAWKLADEGLRLALNAQSEWVELHARSVVAAVALATRQEDECKEQLRVLFTLLPHTAYCKAFVMHPEWAARLCVEALNIGIPATEVRRVTGHFGLKSPSPDLQAWPWQVRVYALGQFRIEVEDTLLTFSRKTPKKPIALLKALIAFGRENVPLDQVVDAIWPDEEGDSGHDACWLSIHRLRKLLGSAETILLTDGRLSLNSELVWTDVGAFENAKPFDTESGTIDMEPVLSLYKGDFLPGEAAAPWAAATRERLRGKFVHRLEQHGQELEDQKKWDDAISWYLRGIDADSIAETFYQGLIRCHRAQGRTAEALSAYRRLKQTLSITLGIAPSASTEAIARDLRSPT